MELQGLEDPLPRREALRWRCHGLGDQAPTRDKELPRAINHAALGATDEGELARAGEDVGVEDEAVEETVDVDYADYPDYTGQSDYTGSAAMV